MAKFLIKRVIPLLLLVPLPAMAQNGRIPIPFAPVVTPIVITAPGSYVVTRNLVPTPAGAAGPIIVVAVPGGPPGDVQIDLNGMILDNTPNPNDPVIRVTIAGTSEVTLRNGTLIGGSAGIEAFGPGRKLVIEDVKISDFTASAHLAGIHVLDVFNTVIRRCVIIDTVAPGPGAGIFLDGGIPRQATIEDNLIQNTADGIIATPLVAGLEISNNRLLNIQAGGPFGAAINLDGAESCLISQNTIDFVAGAAGLGTGIRLRGALGCKVYNNIVMNTSFHGIEITGGSAGHLVLNNVVRQAAFDGIFVGGSRNHIDRNLLTDNGTSGTGFGLHFGLASTDNNFGRNSAMGNPGGACAFPCSLDLCDDAGPPGAFPNWSFGDNLMPGGICPI